MSNQPKSASKYRVYRDRSMIEFLDEELMLLHVEVVTFKKDGSPMPFGPMYVMNICVNSTGEQAEVIAKGKHVFEFLDDALTIGEYPVKFIIRQPKKAFEVEVIE